MGEPEIGIKVRRKDDGREGTVVNVVKPGDRIMHVFQQVGDVEVSTGPGTSIVTPVVRFWERWERA